MTAVYGALAANGVALAILTLAFLRVLRAERREHRNETALLVNQLLHAVGKPWQEPPASSRNGDDEDGDVFDAERFTYHTDER